MNGQSPQKHPYARVMTIATWTSAFVGAIAGVCLILFFTNDVRSSTGKNGILYAPFIFGTIGFMIGMAFSFLFAPTAYLESEAGKKWLDKVGTKTIPSARIVCGIIAALAMALFIAIAMAFVNEQ